MIVPEYGVYIDRFQKPELFREKEHIWTDEMLNNPEMTAGFMNICLKANIRAEEYVYIICLNSKLMPIGVCQISQGNVNTSIVDVRSVLTRAILCGAVSFVLIHNHPSGIIEPSEEDRYVTKKVIEAGAVMNIPLNDHIIIGGNSYYSFREHGEI